MSPPDPEHSDPASTTNDYSSANSSLSGVDPHPHSDTTLRSATSCFSGEKSEFEPHDMEVEVVETGSTEVVSVSGEKSEPVEVVETGSTEDASVSGEKSEPLEVVETGSTEVASVSGEKSESLEVVKTGSTEVASVSGEKSEPVEVVKTGSTEVASVTYIQENFTTNQVYDFMQKNEREFSFFEALPNAAGTVTEASEVNDVIERQRALPRLNYDEVQQNEVESSLFAALPNAAGTVTAEASEVNDVIERQRAHSKKFDEVARIAFAEKYHENCGILRTIYANHRVNNNNLEMERSLKKVLSPYDPRLLELIQETLPRLNLFPDRSIGESQEFKGVKELPSIPEEE